MKIFLAPKVDFRFIVKLEIGGFLEIKSIFYKNNNTGKSFRNV